MVRAPGRGNAAFFLNCFSEFANQRSLPDYGRVRQPRFDLVASLSLFFELALVFSNHSSSRLTCITSRVHRRFLCLIKNKQALSRPVHAISAWIWSPVHLNKPPQYEPVDVCVNCPHRLSKINFVSGHFTSTTYPFVVMASKIAANILTGGGTCVPPPARRVWRRSSVATTSAPWSWVSMPCCIAGVRSLSVARTSRPVNLSIVQMRPEDDLRAQWVTHILYHDLRGVISDVLDERSDISHFLHPECVCLPEQLCHTAAVVLANSVHFRVRVHRLASGVFVPLFVFLFEHAGLLVFSTPDEILGYRLVVRRTRPVLLAARPYQPHCVS